MKITLEQRQRHDAHGNAPELLSEKDAEKIEEGNYSRASGLCTCSKCGTLFADHFPVIGALWLTRLCDGRLVHL